MGAQLAGPAGRVGLYDYFRSRPEDLASGMD
jgi:hypothetical protein